MRILTTPLRALLFLLPFTLLGPVHAQVQWLRQGGVSGEGLGVSADAADNAYVVGTVGDPVLFDADSLPGHFADAFVAKYDAAGTLQWVHTGGGLLIDQANAIATAADGTSYVTGFYRTNGVDPEVVFDADTLTGAGSSDLFVAKYAADGTLLWIRHGGGPLAEEGRGIALTPEGDVVVCGFFQGEAVFEGTTLNSAGSSDVLLLKYGADGHLIWAYRAGGGGQDEGNAVVVDGNGRIGVVGSFQQVASFGGTNIASTGLTNAFIGQYSSAGAAVWAHGGGSDLSFAGDRAYAIAQDASGAYTISGEIAGAADFDGIDVGTNGAMDLFLAHYTYAGTVQWVHHAGGPQADHGYGVDVEPDGTSYLTGQVSDGASTAFDTIVLAPFGNEAVFLAKYAPNGTVQWARRYAPGLGRAVHTLGAGCLYFTGGASGQVGQPAFDDQPWQYVDRAIFTARFCATEALAVEEGSTAEQSLGVYPVPSVGLVHLHLPASAQGTVRVQLMDVSGRVVHDDLRAAAPEEVLDLSGLAPGHYLVQVSSPLHRYSARLVMER